MMLLPVPEALKLIDPLAERKLSCHSLIPTKLLEAVAVPLKVRLPEIALVFAIVRRVEPLKPCKSKPKPYKPVAEEIPFRLILPPLVCHVLVVPRDPQGATMIPKL